MFFLESEIVSLELKMAKSLRNITRKPIARKDIWKYLDRWSSDTSDFRSLVITAAAFIDAGLEGLIKSRMRRLTPDEDRAIFNGALSSFAVKVRIAYAFGIIGPVTRRDLTLINEIRNVLAHSPHNVTLRNEELFQKVLNLRVISVFVERGYLHGNKRKLLENRQEGLHEAMVAYMMMLCVDKPRRAMLPPTRGTMWGLKGSTLRY
jgi:DNA-binding MltR family transcriptional regulator